MQRLLMIIDNCCKLALFSFIRLLLALVHAQYTFGIRIRQDVTEHLDVKKQDRKSEASWNISYINCRIYK
uniref:Putative secreted protein n=1 Tax=Anopheles marajoara TaxID=58244 RepID=A0A2M4CEU6_9DIPT